MSNNKEESVVETVLKNTSITVGGIAAVVGVLTLIQKWACDESISPL